MSFLCRDFAGGGGALRELDEEVEERSSRAGTAFYIVKVQRDENRPFLSITIESGLSKASAAALAASGLRWRLVRDRLDPRMLEAPKVFRHSS